MDDPGERDLRRGGRVRVRHLAQRTDQVTGAIEVVWVEVRAGHPDGIRGPTVPVKLARQQSLCQRAVSDQHPIVCLGKWQEFTLRRAGDKAVAHLIAQYSA